MSEYIPKAKTKIIKFDSRASIKVRDNFYTIEYGEERQIDDSNNVDIDKEVNFLIDYCNNVVDKQVEEIINTLLHNERN